MKISKISNLIWSMKTSKKLNLIWYSPLVIGVLLLFIAWYDFFNWQQRGLSYELTLEFGVALIIFSVIGLLAQRYLADYIKDKCLEILHLLGSGICNFQALSKEVDYKDMINSSKFLVVGLHYKPSMTIFSRCGPDLGNKLKNNEIKILIYHVDMKGSIAYDYICENGGCPSTDEYFKNTILRSSLYVNENNTNIRFETHKKVLRYAFVYSPELIWLIFYPSNTEAPTPALAIEKGSKFFDFIKKDIEELDNYSEHKSWLESKK